jgi:NAD(P)-dependent dehydrogenase (short-subunit alcohol dehydrogenase family)
MQTQTMAGQVCLVTGASSGIGKMTVLALVRRGATVIMVCRNRAKGEQVQEEIKGQSGNEHVDLLIADMSSLASIRQLVQEVRQRYTQLHVLVNNAGGMTTRREVTADGLERTFATNYLGPFLLTHLLLDLLKASAPARVINVSSSAHRFGKINFDDLQSEQHYTAFRVYGTTKLELIHFTHELANRLTGTGVTVNALHPGVVATSFFGDGPLWPLASHFLLTPEQGAQTTVYLATSPAVEGVSGKYFVESRQQRSSRASYDVLTRKRLWAVSEELIGVEQAEFSLP